MTTTEPVVGVRAPRPRLPGWVDGRNLLVALLLGHLLLKLLLLPRVLDAPLQGDEVAYFDAAKALSNLLRDAATLGSPDRAELADNVVGNGWFMPGMAVVLAPLLVVLPDPDLGAVRLYLGLFTLALFALTLRSVDRTFGRPWTLALLVVPGLVPVWVLFSFTAWGDHAAGLVAVILVCLMTEVGRDLVAGRAPRPRSVAGIGALAAAALYLRSSTFPLVLGMLVLLALGAVLLARRGSRRRVALGVVAAGGVFAFLLAPWSLGASEVLGGRVVTTSTVPVSTAVAFGDVDRICFGPCGDSNIWFASARYSQEVARATGVSELVVQRQMSDYALQPATPAASPTTSWTTCTATRSSRRARAGLPRGPRLAAGHGVPGDHHDDPDRPLRRDGRRRRLPARARSSADRPAAQRPAAQARGAGSVRPAVPAHRHPALLAGVRTPPDPAGGVGLVSGPGPRGRHPLAPGSMADRGPRGRPRRRRCPGRHAGPARHRHVLTSPAC